MSVSKLLGPAVLTASLLFQASESSAQPLAATFTYADLADLSLAAPIVAHVETSRAIRIKGEGAANVPAGHSRFYIEAEIVSLIRGSQGLPSEIRYLVDVPNDARGRAPKIAKESQHLLFATAVPQRPGELRLVSPDAQLPWTAGTADRVRQILIEATHADSAPQITGIGKAFHVPGSLPGESETQIFLQTTDGRPVSLNVLRRPGEQPRWSVALSEIVDAAAAPPPSNTLLWYRLACTLPSALPRQSFVDSASAEVAAIQEDYRLILDRLGPCSRSRG